MHKGKEKKREKSLVLEAQAVQPHCLFKHTESKQNTLRGRERESDVLPFLLCCVSLVAQQTRLASGRRWNGSENNFVPEWHKKETPKPGRPRGGQLLFPIFLFWLNDQNSPS